LIVYASRALPLRLLLNRLRASALTYVAPRGLITILLFMGIPPEFRLAMIPDSLLLWAVLISSLVMTWGVIKHSGDEDPDPPAEPEAASDPYEEAVPPGPQ
ncbi:MAG: hypothetical protein M0025_03200, partial [Elusimicrobia bacterium]|nr:hypothetical protein [Elusimicrobiota bacterium]